MERKERKNGFFRSLPFVLFVPFLLFLSVPSFAAFEDLGAGARAPGMGGAFVGVADDVYSIYYNPAGLGTLTRPSLGTSYSKLFWGLSDGSDLGTSFIGYAQPLGVRGTVGLAWNSFSLNSSLYRDDSIYLSYGDKMPFYPFGGALYLGANLKYLRSSFGGFSANLLSNGSTPANPILNGPNTKSAFAADLGALYNVARHYSVGVDVSNINQPNIAFDPNNPETLPMAFKVGLDYRSLISNVVAEYDNEASPYFTRESIFTVGAERWFPITFVGDFGLRGGLSVGSLNFTQISAGLSYRTTRLEADYAFDMPMGSVSNTVGDQRLALTFRFGSPSEQEESLEMVLEAMRRLRAGKPAALGASVSGLSAEDKARLDALLAQARDYEGKAQYKNAVDTLAKAMTIAPSDPNLIRQFGRLHFVAQLYPVLAAYTTDPEQAALHQGVLAYVGGDDQSAIQDVGRALRIKPDDQGLRVFFEELQRLTGITVAGLPSAQKKISNDVAAALLRADTAIGNRQYRLALEFANQALASEPKNVEAWEDAGIAYLGLRNFEDSLRAWKKAYNLEKRPSMRAVIANYIKSVRELENSVWAQEQPAQVLPKLSQAEEDTLFNDGIDHYTKREFQQAAEDFQKILDADPTNQEARKALERVMEELKAQ